MNKLENYANPYELIYQNDLKKALNDLMYTCLTDREKTVIIERFGLFDGKPKTLKDIGLKINRSKETVRHIEAKALRKLRHPTYKISLKIRKELYPDYHEFDRKKYYRKLFYTNGKEIEIINGEEAESISPSVFLVINSYDSPKMKFKKFLINYPHLCKFEWTDDFSEDRSNRMKVVYAFMPNMPNLLYMVHNLKDCRKDIYKWAYPKGFIY